MKLRPFLIKAKLKLKALAVKYRPHLRPLSVSEFFADHWAGTVPNSDYLSNQKERRFFFESSDMATLNSMFQSRFSETVSEIELRADNFLDHKFDLLGSGVTNLGQEIDWHKDFKSGFKWPLEHYTKIQTVDLSNKADVKIPWELSRLQHLITLGQAFWLTDDIRCKNEFTSTIKQWEKQNPFDVGVNWTCSMEVAIRAINIIWSLHLFGGKSQLPEDFVRRVIRLLYYHALHIEHNLEAVDSGSNTNHLLANYLGLFYVGLLFPEFDRSESWLLLGKRGLEEEIILQVNEDGADYECSTSYHRLVLEMFLQAYVLGKINKIEYSRELQDRLQSMIEFSVEMTGQSGLVPAIGDNDDGFIIKLDNVNPCDHRPLIDIGAQLFAVKVPENVSAAWERLWYLGAESLNRWPNMKHRRSKLFKNSGYGIVQNDRIHLTFNACGITEKAFGGHKHNDLLSVSLEIDSETFLIDSGTGCYTSDPELRNRSRSTAAHNTIAIDNQEQQRFLSKALFFMFRDANPKIDLWTITGDKVILRGYHKGYERICNGLIHRRTIEISLKKQDVFIHDEVIGNDNREHILQCNLITPFACQLLKDENSADIISPTGKQIRLRFISNSRTQLKCEPTVYFPKYGITKTAMKLNCSSQTKLPFNLTTQISLRETPSPQNRIEYGTFDIIKKEELIKAR